MADFHIDPMLSKVAENLSLSWAYIDADLNYRKVSKGYADTLQMLDSDIENNSLLKIVGEEAYNHLSPYLKSVLAGEEVNLHEDIRLSSRSGLFHRHATYLPHFVEGRVAGFFVFMNDLTENNRAIETLRSLHLITSDSALNVDQKIQGILALGKSTFDLPLALVSHIHGECYTVKYADTPGGEVKPGDDFELGVTYCLHTLNADGPTAFEHVEHSDISEHPCYQAFGLEAYIGVPLLVTGKRYGTLNFSGPEPHLTPFTDNDYELIRLFAQWIGNELSNQRVAQDLARQKTLLDAMSQQARIGAWELDLVKSELYWSPMTKAIHEVPDDFEPDVSTAIEFYKEGKSREQITEAVNKGIEQGIPWQEELQLVTAKGKEIWVDALGQAEFKDGQCVRLYGSFQDIDKRVRSELELKEAKEKAEQAARSKSAFLANMSHEIRTPMNGVLGMLSVLGAGELDDDTAQKLSIARHSAGSLLSLLDDILDFSKVDAGHLELDETVFHLGDLFHTFSESVRFDIEEKGLSLKLELEGMDDIWVKADPGRIRQILYNLVGNAIKFTKEGLITIRAKLTHHNDRRALRCAVIDSGIGIELEKQKQLFDPFTQADTSTTRNYGGTGLGLAIVKQLCELMKGGVWLESEPGAGSTFRFGLNLAAADKPKVQDVVVQPRQTVKKDEVRILLVEDNAINQLVAKEILSHLGYAVDLAENGLEALSVLKEGPESYDLVLMDCQMPVMDGYEATAKIREGQAGDRYIHVPIIALTANAMKGDREKCIESGMSDYLSKPVAGEELDQALNQHLSVEE